MSSIRDQLIAKYGPEFSVAAMENKDNCVNEKLRRRLDVRPPSKKLVNAYLQEIASICGIDWTAPLESPPPEVMQMPTVPDFAKVPAQAQQTCESGIDTSPSSFQAFLTQQSQSYQQQKQLPLEQQQQQRQQQQQQQQQQQSLPRSRAEQLPPSYNDTSLELPTPPTTIPGNKGTGRPRSGDSDSDDDFGDLTARFQGGGGQNSAKSPAPPSQPPANSDSDSDFDDLAARFARLKK